MALTDTLEDSFDLLGIPLGQPAPGEGGHFDSLAVEIAAADIDDAEHPEPSLAAAPLFIEFDDPVRLDPDRIGLAWELPPAVSQWALRWRSPLLALTLHLLPAIAIIVFPLLMVEPPPPPIPVRLVIEQTPPEPEPQPAEQPPAPQPAHAEAQSQPVQPAPAPPKPVHAALQTRPPPPPKPAPVSHPAKPPVAVAPASAPPRPHEAAIVQFPGAGTSRDGYLAYLATLTRQHMNLLPRSLVGGRRGETVLIIAVQRDGVIDRIGVARSSGYPDIDNRIEQMLAAVGKFPPVPDAFEGSPVELTLDFLFPEALQAH